MHACAFTYDRYSLTTGSIGSETHLLADVQPSEPEDIPGEDKHLTSRLRGAAEGALQAFAPVRGIHQHVRRIFLCSVGNTSRFHAGIRRAAGLRASQGHPVACEALLNRLAWR